MDGHGKSEDGRFDVPDFRPRPSTVGRFEDAIVMLHPEYLGIRGTLHEAVDVLNVRITLLFGRIILGAHTAAGLGPGFPGVSRDPDAASRHADADVARIARIDANGMNSGPFGAVRAPLFAFGMVPKRTIQFPGLTTVFRFEQAAGHCPAPDQARLIRAARCEAPYEFERPIERLVEEGNGFGHISFGHRRILRRRDLLPGLPAVR